MQLRDLWVLIRSHQQRVPQAGTRGLGEPTRHAGSAGRTRLRLSLSEWREVWLTSTSRCDQVLGLDLISLLCYSVPLGQAAPEMEFSHFPWVNDLFLRCAGAAIEWT